MQKLSTCDRATGRRPSDVESDEETAGAAAAEPGRPARVELAPAAPAQSLATSAPSPAASAQSPSTPASSPATSAPAPYPRRPWLWRMLPTPAGTPFTFFYGLVLLATSLFAEFGDPATVAALLERSSTDVAHLAQSPLVVLVASALWIAGGLASPYAIAFVFVLTTLERRIGGWRTAAVFVAGHAAATLATEIPVGLSVAAGQLPATSLHRLDYGISFGLMASIGALAGLFRAPLRAATLGLVSLVLVQDLLAFQDPLTNWGHPLALLVGLACWPLVRRWSRQEVSPRAEPRTPRAAREAG
ncbi:rhomboid-like protein [Streptomyces sp. NPDC051907]|uniref:rhomboid-like protein n=1 Tax=Streptomyces sp. NPDC051907 TaxID=3155284 RepID=UPI00343707E0